MKQKLVLATVMLGAIVVLPMRAMDAAPAVTIYMVYDTCIPGTGVYRATSQATRMFARIGVTLQFRYGRKTRTAGQSGPELEMYVGMQAPNGTHSNALGISHPFSQGGRIEVFYSRIQNFRPEFSRSMVLGYIMAHEIGHALEGIDRHARTGVMKADWNFDDMNKIRVGAVEFDSSDVELIRMGIENKVRRADIARANSVSKIVR